MEMGIKLAFAKSNLASEGTTLEVLNDELLKIMKSSEDCKSVINSLNDKGDELLFVIPEEVDDLSPVLDKIVQTDPALGKDVLKFLDNILKRKQFNPDSYNSDDYAFAVHGMEKLVPIIVNTAQKCPKLKDDALSTLENVNNKAEQTVNAGLEYPSSELQELDEKDYTHEEIKQAYESFDLTKISSHFKKCVGEAKYNILQVGIAGKAPTNIRNLSTERI